MTAQYPDKIRLTITNADIISGKRFDCESCPIALAFRRQCYQYLKPGSRVEVYSTHIELFPAKADEPIVWENPPNVAAFMSSFDDCLNDGAVKPFTFTAEKFQDEPRRESVRLLATTTESDFSDAELG